MKSRNKKILAVVAVLTIVATILPGAILTGNPLESSDIYSLFLDWLGGKSMGLINLNVVTVDENGNQIPAAMDKDFMIYVHNFSYTLYGSQAKGKGLKVSFLHSR